VEELLNPEKRIPKVYLTSAEIVVDVAPQVKIGDLETGLSLKVPKDFPAIALNSLRFKDLLQDIVLNERDPDKLEAKYEEQLTVKRFKALKQGLADMRSRFLADPGHMLVDITRVQGGFVQEYYSNVLEHVENAGHRFGSELSDREKKALTAFLATL